MASKKDEGLQKLEPQKLGPQNLMASIRSAYEKEGVHAYYAESGAAYRNPHEAAVRAALSAALGHWPALDLAHVLDLACGSGEITLALREMCPAPGVLQVDGIDPYTGEAYRERTGQPAEACSFEQIAAGALAGRQYSLIVCSYALHLAPVSRLPLLAYQLARMAPALLVLSPHKRPQLRPEWGWRLEGELYVERVRVRWYTADRGEGI